MMPYAQHQTQSRPDIAILKDGFFKKKPVQKCIDLFIRLLNNRH